MYHTLARHGARPVGPFHARGFGSDRDHPLAPGGQSVRPLKPVRLIKQLRSIIPALGGAHRDNFFRRALQQQKWFALGMMMDGRHEAMPRIEGNLVYSVEFLS